MAILVTLAVALPVLMQVHLGWVEMRNYPVTIAVIASQVAAAVVDITAAVLVTSALVVVAHPMSHLATPYLELFTPLQMP